MASGWARLVLVPVVLGLAATAICAQTPEPPPERPRSESPPAELPSDLDRVRRGLDRPSTGLREAADKQTAPTTDTTFRVSVTERVDVRRLLGEPTTAVSSEVHPWYFSSWHHEYLRMVTPEYARRAALYPQGMISASIIPVLANVLKAAYRSHAEREAKREVQEALEEFFRLHPEARQPVPSAPPPDKKPDR